MKKLIIFLIVSLFFIGCYNDLNKSHYVKYEIYGNCPLVSINNEIITSLDENKKFVYYESFNYYHPVKIKIEKLIDDNEEVYLNIYDYSVLIYSDFINTPYGVIDYSVILE